MQIKEGTEMKHHFLKDHRSEFTLKKFVVTTDSKHNEPLVPNLMNREFDVKKSNSSWVSDITYLKD